MKVAISLRASLIYVSCLMLTFAYPVAVYAEEPVDQTTTTVAEPVAPEPVAPVPPTEPEPAAPVAPEPAAPVQATYTYDAETGRWSSNVWQYDPATNSYVPVPAAPEPTVAVSPVEGQNEVSNDPTSTTNAALANALDSLALSGDATVASNTTGGSAATGNTLATATVINNVNSTMTNANNKEAASFVSNVMGDVNGDIMLQPMLLKAMLEANAANKTTMNSNTDTSITNDINLAAQSGDASVLKNTQAGNATSGSADTVANIANIVNSMIAANQSFTGTINIYGNLNGDILIAPDFIPQLLAANGGDLGAQPAATTVNANDTQSIVNNVSLAAASGQALVEGNTAAGSATTGDAKTNLVIFNLSGHQIVASNSLLVFINVLGQWVGVIVDAPVGATAAALGNNVTSNESVSPDLVINAANQTQLTNNINLASLSGDATVAGNTRAGNATTGNATASANIANISNSSLGLSGWFGILFINVFGKWNGSFGINTAAGDAIQQQPVNSSGPAPVMVFIPRDNNTKRASSSLNVIDPANDASGSDVQQASAHNESPVAESAVKSDIPTQQDYINARVVNIPLIIGSVILVGVSLFALRRYLF